MNSLSEILEDLKRGKVVIVIDDEDRENEGDFIVAAPFATPKVVNFLASRGRGLICAAMAHDWGARLGLEVPDFRHRPGRPVPPLQGTRFTQSVDWLHGTTTGISAGDRSASLVALADHRAQPEDFASPGHIFPLLASPGGLKERRGHTEAAVELCRWAQLPPVGVICEILNPDGSMARTPQLKALAQKWKLKITTIERIVGEKKECV